MRTTRRQLLRSAVALMAISLGLPARARGRGASDAALHRRASGLVGIFSEPRSAARIGRAYLQAHPEESSLEGLLVRVLPGARAAGTTSPGRDREVALRMHRSDLTHARITRVDGWLVSRTEARLCALAALLAERRDPGELRVH